MELILEGVSQKRRHGNTLHSECLGLLERPRFTKADDKEQVRAERENHEPIDVPVTRRMYRHRREGNSEKKREEHEKCRTPESQRPHTGIAKALAEHIEHHAHVDRKCAKQYSGSRSHQGIAGTYQKTVSQCRQDNADLRVRIDAP